MAEWWVKYQGKIPGAGIFYQQEDWISLRSSKGHKLWTYRFHNNSPKSLIFIFHGMHASAGVASHIALSLHQTNNAVFAFDQESHGKSEGPKGNIRDINEYIDCGIIFIQKTLELYQANTPIFIIGESMGGLICINISIRIPALIRGMILFAPAVGLAQTPSCFDKFLLGLALCCCPNANAAGKDDGFSEMSRNEWNNDWNQENPESYTGVLTARTANALLQGVNRINKRFKEIKTPFIVFQGGDDLIVDERAVREFFNQADVIDKEIVYYPDMRHDVCHEPEIVEIIDTLLFWVQNRS